METDLKRLTAILADLGVEGIPHTGKTYLGHLVAVYKLMERRGCTEELCLAGLFHSIYGTQLFQGFKLGLDRRGEVRELIGERAERLAYLNCAMDRATLDRSLERAEEPYPVVDRLTGEEVLLSRRDFDDLCRVHLYDWLEQAPRSSYGYGYRREAFRRMAERLGGPALEAYDEVFSREPAAQG